MQLDIDKIRTNGGTQVRASIDDETVRRYAEALRDGVRLPEVVVFYDGSWYWLADGFHRLEAHRLIEAERVPADVRQGSRRDAILYSVGANEDHGLPRTTEDKRRAVETLLRDEEWGRWSDREIGRRARVSHTFVGTIRGVTGRDSSERTYTTKHGTVTTMRTENIGRGEESRQQPYVSPDAELVHESTVRSELAEANDGGRPAAYMAGRDACLAGVDLDEGNAHIQSSRAWHRWRIGWLDAAETLSELRRSGNLTTIEPTSSNDLPHQDETIDGADSGEQIYTAPTDVHEQRAEHLRPSEDAEDRPDPVRAPNTPPTPSPPAPRPHVANNSGNDEWYTPGPIIEAARRAMGSISLDPASCRVAQRQVRAGKYFTAEDDGLKQRWHGNVWLNPPYSTPLVGLFADAVSMKLQSGEIDQACVLVNNATETGWFQAMVPDASALCLLCGRVRFLDSTGTPAKTPLQGQIVLYFGDRVEQFADAFGELGHVIVRKPVLVVEIEQPDPRQLDLVTP